MAERMTKVLLAKTFKKYQVLLGIGMEYLKKIKRE